MKILNSGWEYKMKRTGILIGILVITNSSYAQQKIRIGMVHDYIFINAMKQCLTHQGLHYIISINTIFDKNDKRHTCSDLYKFRCQDRTVINFNSGIKWCGVSEIQLEETLK